MRSIIDEEVAFEMAQQESTAPVALDSAYFTTLPVSFQELQQSASASAVTTQMTAATSVQVMSCLKDVAWTCAADLLTESACPISATPLSSPDKNPAHLSLKNGLTPPHVSLVNLRLCFTSLTMLVDVMNSGTMKEW